MHSRHAALGQQAHVLRRDPDAVGRNGARVKDMVAVEHLRGCQAVSLEALLMLSLCLGQVDVHTGLLVDGKFAQRVPKAVVRGILAVHGGLDADAAVVIAVPLFLQGDKLAAGGVRFKVEVLAEQRRAAGDVCLDAGLGHGLGDLVAEIIHIRDGCRAEADALGNGQQGCRLGAAAVEPVLMRENIVVEPARKLDIVGIAAQHRHRQMRVAVDEAGHEHHALTGNKALCLLLGGLAREIADLAVRHAEVGIKVDVHGLVHGHDRHIGK